MISVIMATYNGEKFIIQQLNSIKNQTKQPDEVIIKDDASSDNTCYLITKYIEDNKLNHWKLYVNQVNKGFVRNFYEALELSNGELIFLCDQDDILLPNKIDEMSNLMNKSNAMMLHSEIDVINEKDEVIAHHYEGLKNGFSRIDLEKYIRIFHYCGMSSVLNSELKEVCLKINPEFISTHDWFWGLIASFYHRFYITSAVFTQRRFHSKNVAMSMSNKPKREGIRQRVKIIDESIQFYSSAKHILYLIDEGSDFIIMIDKFFSISMERRNNVKNRKLWNAICSINKLYYYPTIKSYLGDLLYIAGFFD